jgi:hypothetical protein
MTIDERLEALTMHLELTARKQEDDFRKHEEDYQRLERQLAVERESRKLEMEHERNRLDVLTTAVENLLTVSNASLTRIERLERRTA